MFIVSTFSLCIVVEYVNLPLGVFLCPLCAHTHKFLEWPFKDVRPLFSTQWEQIELEVYNRFYFLFINFTMFYLLSL